MLQPHEVRYGEYVFRRLNSAGKDEPSHDRGTGYVLRDKPVHAGAAIVPAHPRGLSGHAKCCAGMRDGATWTDCDCGVYGFWKAVTGGEE